MHILLIISSSCSCEWQNKKLNIRKAHKDAKRGRTQWDRRKKQREKIDVQKDENSPNCKKWLFQVRRGRVNISCVLQHTHFGPLTHFGKSVFACDVKKQNAIFYFHSGLAKTAHRVFRSHTFPFLQNAPFIFLVFCSTLFLRHLGNGQSLEKRVPSDLGQCSPAQRLLCPNWRIHLLTLAGVYIFLHRFASDHLRKTNTIMCARRPRQPNR